MQPLIGEPQATGVRFLCGLAAPPQRSLVRPTLVREAERPKTRDHPTSILDPRPSHLATVTIERKRSLPIVNFTPMCGANNSHRQGVIEGIVNNTIITHPDSPSSLLSHELLGAVRSRVLRKASNYAENAPACRLRELPYLACRGGGDLDTVLHETCSAISSSRGTRPPSSTALASR